MTKIKLSEKIKQRLYQKAKEASKQSYSPYSRFPVGAALLARNNKIFIGTNVENVSFGLTICAERVAICNAIINGAKRFIAIAVYSKKGEATPCGACRQFLLEFGKDIEVIFKKNNNLESLKISELIPRSFLKGELK
jgi:cytidine deaminase